MSLATEILAYWGIPPKEVFEKEVIFPITVDHSRYDQGKIIKLANGTWLMAVGRYGEVPNDYQDSELVFYTNPDISDLNGWTLLSVIPNGSNIGILIPVIQQKTNGDIYLVYFEILSLLGYCRLLTRTSTDGGATWSAFSVLRENADETINGQNAMLHVTNTGRWLLAFQINTNDDPGSATGNYTGYCMYSDNEGGSWTVSASAIVSPSGFFGECGFYQLPNNTVVMYGRNRSDKLEASNSANNGVTWQTSVYNIVGVTAENSTSVVVKLTGSHSGFIACTNPVIAGDAFIRKVLRIFYSADGITFSRLYDLEWNTTVHYIEPFMIQEGDYVYVYYSQSDATTDKFGYKVCRIPLNEYLP